MAGDDDDLVALIDGQLAEPRRSEVLARLDRDPRLRERFEALSATSAPIEAALDRALNAAPLDRLRGFLPAGEAASPPPAHLARRFGWPALGALAASFAVGLAVAAGLMWFVLGGAGREGDWRSAVIDYMDLYTSETFAFPTPDGATQARELAAVGGRVGVPLTPEQIALPGLDMKVAFILGYEGAPLAEIAYAAPSGEPMLLCILGERPGEQPLRLERRGPYALATWARGGRKYLVIGRLPESRVAEYGRTLEARL